MNRGKRDKLNRAIRLATRRRVAADVAKVPKHVTRRRDQQVAVGRKALQRQRAILCVNIWADAEISRKASNAAMKHGVEAMKRLCAG